jgi:hypothetical protein
VFMIVFSQIRLCCQLAERGRLGAHLFEKGLRPAAPAHQKETHQLWLLTVRKTQLNNWNEPAFAGTITVKVTRRPRTMPSSPLEDVLRYVRRVCKIPAFANLTDRELLERFLSRREEHAFGCLVERHGAMVFRVCRRVLGNTHEAEDALQATFLVLVRRAGFIRRKSSLASWLYGVAERIALAEAGAGNVAVSIWDIASGRQRQRFEHPGNRIYFSLAFSPDGKKVAAGSWNAETPNFRLWDLESGKELRSCDPDHWVNSISFSPDGTLVALASGGDHKRCVSVWKLATATQLQRFTVPGMEGVSAFSPSGRVSGRRRFLQEPGAEPH